MSTNTYPAHALLRALSLAIAVPLLVSASASAEVRSGQSVVIAAGTRVVGNLYLSGGTITVHGDVDGDLVAAGGTVLVDGHVTGDVLATGGDLTIGGVVDGDVRAAAGRLRVLGPVRGDVAAAGGEVRLSNTIGRDAFALGSAVIVGGGVGGELTLAAGQARLEGAVSGDVDANVGRLHLAPGAVIGGSLSFTGDALERAPSASIVGRVVERAQPSYAGLRLIGWLQAIVGICVFGALWITLFRGFAERAIDTLAARPWRSLGVGLSALFGVPLFLGVCFALGALLGGWWIALLGGAAYLTAIAIAFPLVAAYLGRRLIARKGAARASFSRERWAMLAVLVVLSIASAIPVVGGILGFAVVAFGIGAIAVASVPTLRRAQQPAPSAAISLGAAVPSPA